MSLSRELGWSEHGIRGFGMGHTNHTMRDRFTRAPYPTKYGYIQVYLNEISVNVILSEPQATAVLGQSDDR